MLRTKDIKSRKLLRLSSSIFSFKSKSFWPNCPKSVFERRDSNPSSPSFSCSWFSSFLPSSSSSFLLLPLTVSSSPLPLFPPSSSTCCACLRLPSATVFTTTTSIEAEELPAVKVEFVQSESLYSLNLYYFIAPKASAEGACI